MMKCYAELYGGGYRGTNQDQPKTGPKASRGSDYEITQMKKSMFLHLIINIFFIVFLTDSLFFVLMTSYA